MINISLKVPIKNNIQPYRISKSFTQEKLAKKLGVTRTYLSKLENQKFSPSPDLMAKVCKVFNVDIGDMFYVN